MLKMPKTNFCSFSLLYSMMGVVLGNKDDFNFLPSMCRIEPVDWFKKQNNHHWLIREQIIF